MLLACLAAAALAVAALALWSLNLTKRWQLRHIPGPKPDPVLGNMVQLGPSGKGHETMQVWAEQYGPVYRYYLGRLPCVVLSDPALVRQVAVKQFMHFHDRSQPAVRMGGDEDMQFTASGILFARGRYWLGVRTACEPLFHSAALSSYAPMMNAAADQLIVKLQVAAESGEGVNVCDLLKAAALDVVGSTAFGVDFGAQKEGASSQLVSASEEMFNPTGGLPMWAVFLNFAAPGLGGLCYHLGIRFGAGNIWRTVSGRRYLWGAAQALVDAARKKGSGPAAVDAARTNGGGPAAVDAARTNGGGPAAVSTENPDAGSKSGVSGTRQREQEKEEEGERQVAGEGHAGPKRTWQGLDGYEEAAKPPHASAAFDLAYKAFEGRVPPASSIVSRLKDAVNKQTGSPLSDLDICAQLFTFLLAGYETTSLALSYTLYELARHPEMQQRIMQEVDAFGRDRPIAHEDLAHFEYTEAAFLEGMRLYPPVGPILALAREPNVGGADVTVTAPAQGPEGGATGTTKGGASPAAASKTYHIPAGCRVQFNIWSIHRNPLHYPEPEQYRPERFLPGSEEAARRHPDAYFPFGLGPRKCVGYRFAMAESVLLLARTFQRFHFRLDTTHHAGPLDLLNSVTLIPKGGIWLRAHPCEAGA